MSTESNSSTTRQLAADLAEEVGSYHHSFPIDAAVSAVIGVFARLTGKAPKFQSKGGTCREDLALQNIQARLRMVIAYMLAQLLPWIRGHTNGWLLVLSTANVDEALRGYMTKYDCSSGDLNPIGAVSKADLNRFLVWASKELGYPTLGEIAKAKPTAELRPLDGEDGEGQLDETEMGMTYEELGIFGRLRKLSKCGPASMFEVLLRQWSSLRYTPLEIANKVKRFFKYYAINRHKMTTITPSCHAEDYSPDDNRYDQRQILYRTSWPWQFSHIDQRVVQVTQARSNAVNPPSDQQQGDA
jgi:NAD+ synthase (glutamine-hydrolysing)